MDFMEEKSFRQCCEILYQHPLILCIPKGLDILCYKGIALEYDIKLNVYEFRATYFYSIAGYNSLLLSPIFYLRFYKYEYILIHQLDAYVFNDELYFWCNKGYDYIGAPWLEGYHNATANDRFIGVGNGGFSLRKTSSAITVINLYLLRRLICMYRGRFQYVKIIKLLFLLLTGKGIGEIFPSNEDVFFGEIAKTLSSKYKVPSPIEALKFCFEVQPRMLYRMNNETLPFGTHAYMRYDSDFWEPFMR